MDINWSNYSYALLNDMRERQRKLEAREADEIYWRELQADYQAEGFLANVDQIERRIAAMSTVRGE